MDKNKKLFPQRLWDLIHDQKYNFCLRWSADGQRVFLNRNDFETHYLRTPSNQFHTQKAISFVRQMNMYGFRKVDDCYYENDNFKRNCPHLLKNMIRRHSNKSFYSPHAHHHEHQAHHHQNNHNHNHNHNHHHHQLNHHNLHTPQQLQQNHSHNLLAVAVEHQRQQQDLQAAQAAHQRAQQAAFFNHQHQVGAQASNSPSELASAAPCFGQGAGALANADSPLNSIEAAIAALSSSNSSQSPLESSLYHRLATLNFGQSPEAAAAALAASSEQHQLLLQHQAQQAFSPAASLPQLSPNHAHHHETSAKSQQPELEPAALRRLSALAAQRTGQHHHHPHYDTADVPMSQQQSLAARQAFQQTLIQSLLQLKQPHEPLTLQQNLLSNLQRVQSPTLLLQSLANLSSTSSAASLHSQSAASNLPVLAVNTSPSSSQDSCGNIHFKSTAQAQDIDDSSDIALDLAKR